MPAEPFRFRRDAAEIAALRAVCRAWQEGPDRFWGFDDILAAASRSGSLAYFIAPERVAAWQAVLFADVGPYAADLLYIYVAPEHRRAGLGRRLLTHLLAELASRPQIEALFLEVRASNATAQALYAALGLSMISRRSRYYADGEDALVFRRLLRGTGDP